MLHCAKSSASYWFAEYDTTTANKHVPVLETSCKIVESRFGDGDEHFSV